MLASLTFSTQEISVNQDSVIPKIRYPGDELARRPLKDWVTRSELEAIKHRGVAIIQGVVPEHKALAWKEGCLDYARRNPAMKGDVA